MLRIQSCRKGFEFIRPPPIDDQFCSGFEKCFGGRFANATSAACNDYYLIV